MIDEFSFIKRYFSELDVDFEQSARDMGLELGIGDDAAMLNLQGQYAITTDTLIEKVHFFSDIHPKVLGARCLSVNLSDIYAMGSLAQFVLLSLNIPKRYQEDNDSNKYFWTHFSQGLKDELRAHNCCLIGGNITTIKGRDSPLCISITVLGKSTGKYLARDRVKPGDLILVTGELGLNGLFVDSTYDGVITNLGEKERKQFESKAFSYDSRIAKFVPRLVKYGVSGIDVSDGLLGDLSHMLSRSNMRAEIELSKLPISVTAMHLIDRLYPNADGEFKLLDCALNAGGDYNLLFTLPKENWILLKAELERDLELAELPIKEIGRVIDATEGRAGSLETDLDRIKLVGDCHLAQRLKRESFNHFSPNGA